MLQNFLRAMGRISLSVILIYPTLLHAEPAQTLDWLDLVPSTQRDDVLAQKNTNFHDLDKMSDAIIKETKARLQGLQQDPQLVTKLDNTAVKIPGYIVPLEFGDVETVYEFLLVPYFGACIHYPPPPINQIIYIKYPQGLKSSDFFEPYWVEGTLLVKGYTSDIAQAGYSLDAKEVVLYEY